MDRGVHVIEWGLDWIKHNPVNFRFYMEEIISILLKVLPMMFIITSQFVLILIVKNVFRLI